MIPPSWTRFSPLFSTLLLQTFETLFFTISYSFYFSSFSLFVIIFYFSSFFITFCLHLWRFTEFRHVVLQHRFLTPNLYFYSRVQRFKFYIAWGTTSLFLIFHHFSSFFVSLYDVSRNFNASFFILFSSFFHHFFIFSNFFIFSKFQPKKTLLITSVVPPSVRSLVPRSLKTVVAHSYLVRSSLPNLLSPPPYRNYPYPTCSHMRVLRLHFDI